MDDEIRVNLAASVHGTALDLSEVADSLAGLSTNDEIEQQARILDRIAEEANEGATILRTLIIRRERMHSPLPRRVPGEAANVYRLPPGPDGGAS
jgi:hypothetical protein